LSREEFGLQAEGENRRMELLRRGLSGFMAALKTRGTALGMARSPFIPVLLRSWLSPSFFRLFCVNRYILC
jgi:hypothetical protein